jgi:uncharacterized membrane protein
MTAPADDYSAPETAPETATDNTPPEPARHRAFSSPEGRILRLGLALASAYILFLITSYFISPQYFQIFIGMTATNILFGRAAGMSLGYAMELNHWVVFPVNLAIESILVLLIYPLFVFSWHQMVVIKPLEKFMARTGRAAHANHDRIRRFGIPSLFVFVLFPFWMTGPVIGAVIGFFLELRPWLNIGIVLSGTTLACLGWALVLQNLHEKMADFSPFAPLIVLGVIVAVAIAGYWLESRRRPTSS